MKATQIIHIIPSLAVGGTEKQLLLLLPELQKTLSNEVVCLMGQGPIGKSLQQQGIPVHYLNGRNNTDLLIPFRLWRLLRQKKPKVVITYLIYADIIGRIAAKLAGIKTVIQSHRSHLFGPAWWHQLDRFTRSLVTHHVCQTKATQQALIQTLNIPFSSVTVIPNAVPSQFFSHKASNTSHRQQRNILPTDPVIICVANLKPEKDIPTLLRAFEEVYKTHPTVHLWLVGEGPEHTNLTNQIENYSSKNHIHFLGSQHNIPAILSEADIFVLPTLTEGMSNALLEALATGLSCITTNIPANYEIISHNKTGILLPPGDSGALTQSINDLITNTNRRQQLGQAAIQYTKNHHHIQHITKQWKQVIQSHINL